MKKILFGFIAVMLIVVVLGWLIAFAGTSDGYQDGHIFNFSNKHGWVYSSWEGKMATAGFGGSQSNKDGQDSGNVWAFYVTDSTVVEVIKHITAKQFVRVHYHEPRWTYGHWSGHEGIKIEILDGDVEIPQVKVEKQ